MPRVQLLRIAHARSGDKGDTANVGNAPLSLPVVDGLVFVAGLLVVAELAGCGPLAGVEGRLMRIKSQTRLVLSVELLSQSVATEVDAWDVEPIRERRP